VDRVLEEYCSGAAWKVWDLEMPANKISVCLDQDRRSGDLSQIIETAVCLCLWTVLDAILLYAPLALSDL